MKKSRAAKIKYIAGGGSLARLPRILILVQNLVPILAVQQTLTYPASVRGLCVFFSVRFIIAYPMAGNGITRLQK